MPDVLLSEYDLEWAKSPSFTDMIAVKRMVSEMIAQSVDEYRQLRKMGIILGNRSINPDAHTDGMLKCKSSGYKHVFEVQELIKFFDLNCDKWASAAGLKIESGVIKSRL